MKPSDTHSTLHALGKLAPGESPPTTPLARVHARATEDIATAILLAQSQPPLELPAGTLETIQSSVRRLERRQRFRTMAASGLQWGGWAAAAAMALWIWRAPSIGQLLFPAEITLTPAPSEVPGIGVQPQVQVTTDSPPQEALLAENAKLRAQLEALKKSSTPAKPPRAKTNAQTLTVMLSGGKAVKNSDLVSMLTRALRPVVAQTSGTAAAGATPEIVIESGYAAFNGAALPDGYYFRHLSFPTDQAGDLGLASGPGKSFYDPVGGLLWSPDVVGGGYVGKRPDAGFDATHYTHENPPTAAANETGSGGPSIVTILDPNSNEGQVLMSNPHLLLGPNEILQGWMPMFDPNGSIIGYQPIGQYTQPPAASTVVPQTMTNFAIAVGDKGNDAYPPVSLDPDQIFFTVEPPGGSPQPTEGRRVGDLPP